MKKYNNAMDISFCYDDILLVPANESKVQSRYSVDLSMKIGSMKNPDGIIELKLPIIASPMDTVCEWQMASILSKYGGLGIIHRFMDISSRIEHLKKVEGIKGVAISLLEAQDKDTIFKLLDTGVRVLCIDTANGHASRAIDAVETLRNIVNDDIHIMCGNVATHKGYSSLVLAGADSVRVGIGGGSACTTRIVSGHGIPTLSSIYDCKERNVEFFKDEVTGIIADGGIRSTGDMVKSFAFGSSAIMLGSLLSGYDESPGDIIDGVSETPVKQFRGMASREAQEDWLGGVSVSEGISTIVPYKGKVEDFIKSIIGGIGSGCSYSGVQNLSDIYQYAQYVVVSNSSINESMPHAKNINPFSL
jgi:IMP dehydrogenase